MVVSAAEYRQYAAECLALSERLSNPLDKARLIQMAQDFLSMAEKRRAVDERVTFKMFDYVRCGSKSGHSAMRQ